MINLSQVAKLNPCIFPSCMEFVEGYVIYCVIYHQSQTSWHKAFKVYLKTTLGKLTFFSVDRPVLTKCSFDHVTSGVVVDKLDKAKRPHSAHEGWLPKTQSHSFFINLVSDISEKINILATKAWLQNNFIQRTVSLLLALSIQKDGSTCRMSKF